MLARGTKIINDVFFSIFNLTNPIPLNIRGDLVLLLTGNETGVAADAFIDIDNFQEYAGRMDEAGGDRILKLFADRIQSLFRSDDILGRFGADGFMLLLRRMMDRKLVHEKIGILCNQKFLDENGKSILISSSIGAAFYPGDAEEGYDTLIQKVDYALYEAKKQGKGRLCLFDEVIPPTGISATG